MSSSTPPPCICTAAPGIDISTSGTGNGGTIRINAGTVILDGTGASPQAIDAIAANTSSTAANAGHGGDIDITTTWLHIVDGFAIECAVLGAGNGGNVNVQTKSLLINEQLSSSFTQIASDGRSSATGPAGNVSVVADTIDLLDGGLIKSNTAGLGAGGEVFVSAHNMTLDGGSNFVFTGISSESTSGRRAAPPDRCRSRPATFRWTTRAKSNPTATAWGLRGAWRSRPPRSTSTAETATLSLPAFLPTATAKHKAATPATSTSMPRPSSSCMAGRFLQPPKARATAATSPSPPTPSLPTVTPRESSRTRTTSARPATRGLFISTPTPSRSTTLPRSKPIPAAPATLAISSSRQSRRRIDGGQSPQFTGVSSEAEDGATGKAGDVSIAGDNLLLIHGGQILSDTDGSGVGGNITVSAKVSLTVNGQSFSANPFTEIDASSDADATAKAGNVNVQAGNLQILRGGFIISDAFGAGAGGSVNVRATTLTADSKGSAEVSGIVVNAAAGSTGSAGDITVSADTIGLLAGGIISSDTFGQGHGGSVTVQARSMTFDEQSGSLLSGIDASTEAGASGAAGNISVKGKTLRILNGADIQADTFGQGNGGSVSVDANLLHIDGSGLNTFTGISAGTDPGCDLARPAKSMLPARITRFSSSTAVRSARPPMEPARQAVFASPRPASAPPAARLLFRPVFLLSPVTPADSAATRVISSCTRTAFHSRTADSSPPPPLVAARPGRFRSSPPISPPPDRTISAAAAHSHNRTNAQLAAAGSAGDVIVREISSLLDLDDGAGPIGAHVRFRPRGKHFAFCKFSSLCRQHLDGCHQRRFGPGWRSPIPRRQDGSGKHGRAHALRSHQRRRHHHPRLARAFRFSTASFPLPHMATAETSPSIRWLSR